MSKVRIISVDFQKEFSAEGGKHYKPRRNCFYRRIKAGKLEFIEGIE